MGKGTRRSKRAWTEKDEKYRRWLETGVKLPGKTQKGLAGAIKVSEPTASKLLAGKRRLSLGEVDAISAYFGSGHPPPNGEAHNSSTAGVGVVGSSVSDLPSLSVEAMIAPGFWGRMGGAVSVAAQRAPIPGRIDPRYVGIKQYACTLRDDPNQLVICVPFTAMRSAPLHGDKVHVRRTRENGEQEDTIRIVHISAGSVSLIRPDAPDNDRDKVIAYPSNRNGESVELRGLVIGRFIAED